MQPILRLFFYKHLHVKRLRLFHCPVYGISLLHTFPPLPGIRSQPSNQQHQTLIIEEFEPDVFRQLIEYIHTGCVTLQPRTLLGKLMIRLCFQWTISLILHAYTYTGVMNAADYYGLDELRRACAGFIQCCINVDTVCALLASAEKYIQYKCTKSLVQKVLEFVDEHGNEVLNLGSFTLLPQHVVRLILAREELRADEFTKFQAALMWSKKFCDNSGVSFICWRWSAGGRRCSVAFEY